MIKVKWVGGLLIMAFLLSCSGPRDYIICIDTSGSMSSGKRMIEKVKARLGDFVEDIKLGDSVTLVGFDTNSRVYRTYSIHDQATLQKLSAKIRSLRARGAYTDMQAMLSTLVKLSKKLQAPDRHLLVVIMSDGIDDPPPWKKKDSAVELQYLRKNSWFGYWGEPYIYYISLSKVQDTKLIKNIGRLSRQSKSITDSESAGLGEVKEDAQSQDTYRQFLAVFSLLISIFLVACVTLGIRRFLQRHKLNGTLVYYDADIGRSLSDTIDLSKLKAHSMFLGRKPGAKPKIRGFGLKQNVSLKAKVYKGSLHLKPKKKEETLFSYDHQKRKGLIGPGEKFKVGNFIFEYKK